MHPFEVVTKTAALLADPEHWVTGRLAQTAQGLNTAPTDPNACRFCLVGAVMRVLDLTPGPNNTLPLPFRNLLMAAITDYTGEELAITVFNDSHEHSDVIAVLAHAAALVRPTEPA